MFSQSMKFETIKNKKAKTVLHDFIEIANEFNCQPNMLWVDQGK